MTIVTEADSNSFPLNLFLILEFSGITKNLAFFAIQGLITTDQVEYPVDVQTIVQQGMGAREIGKDAKMNKETKQNRGKVGIE